MRMRRRCGRRCHTGFDQHPPAGILSRAEHEIFMPLLQRGELVLDENHTQQLWPSWGPAQPLRRAVIPLLGAGRRWA